MRDSLYKKLSEMPFADLHTHVDAAHPTARGLHDILLYHMVISELYAAGCPDGARLSEEPDEAEVESRLVRAIPYIPHIRGTSCYWGVRLILSELYGWDEEVTLENWRAIHRVIAEKQGLGWGREILRRCGISRMGTELWRRGGGEADDIMRYTIEWAFFARRQWYHCDAPLLELEYAWSLDEPGPPLPVTMPGEVSFAKTITTLDDVHAAIEHYCSLLPFDKVYGTAQHISTDIGYLAMVTDEDMRGALARRQSAGEAEQNIYASYVLTRFLEQLGRRRPGFLFQFSVGAEPLPFETASRLNTGTMTFLPALLSTYPDVEFQVMSASAHQNQGLCSLVREFPNFSIAGYWWHSFFPSYIRQTIEQRLDMLPANKNICFFSDAYCMDWMYAKVHIVRKQLAEVLAEKIRMGQYTEETALAVAEAICRETPLSYMEGGAR